MFHSGCFDTLQLSLQEAAAGQAELMQPDGAQSEAASSIDPKPICMMLCTRSRAAVELLPYSCLEESQVVDATSAERAG